MGARASAPKDRVTYRWTNGRTDGRSGDRSSNCSGAVDTDSEISWALTLIPAAWNGEEPVACFVNMIKSNQSKWVLLACDQKLTIQSA